MAISHRRHRKVAALSQYRQNRCFQISHEYYGKVAEICEYFVKMDPNASQCRYAMENFQTDQISRKLL